MSAQTMANVHAPAEAHYRNLMLHETWGHLFPEGLYYEGYVRIANSIYSQYDAAVLAERIEISSSPWWYEAITEFAAEVNKDMGEGEVADFKISVTVQSGKDEETDGDWMDEAKTWQKLNIAIQDKIIVAKGY